MSTPPPPEESAPTRRVGRVLAGLLGLGAVAALVVLFGDRIPAWLDGLEGWIDGLGAWGLLAFVLVFVALTSVFVPDTALALVAGGLFGLELGIVLVSVAGILGAVLQYALSRRLLRGPIESAVGRRPTLAAVLRSVREKGTGLQLLLRLTPLNPPMVSYVLGAAGVPFKSYLVACLGLIPAFFVEVYAGYVGRHVAGAAGGASTLKTVSLILGLAACVVVLVVVSRLAWRAVRQAADGS